ncbi:MAG: DegV family protein [Lachnospiraceae bacterium]|nr:DegV family protein [Lachnospiraceae bacterium]
MKNITILTDSTCDLSPELIEKYEIMVFPLHIHLGEKEYSDGVDICPEDIYAWAEEHNTTPKTSALSLFEAKEYLKKALEQSKEVICFCISQQMSSCYDVMCMAVNELEVTDRVFVIDTMNLSTGNGLQILETANLIKKEMSAKQIVEYIQNIQPQIRASFVVDTLTYLHRGGRCSGVAAFAGNALKLHPYIFVTDGKMQAGKKYRGKMEKVIKTYVDDLKPALQNAKKEYIFITHSGCEDSIIQMVKKELEELKYFDEIFITRAGSVITSHCGPGTLGVLFIEQSI